MPVRPDAVEVLLNTDAAALSRVLDGVVCFLVFIAVAIVARSVVRQMLARLRVEQPVVSLVSQTLFYALLILGLITGLGTTGVNVSALVASLGLGGFALGFALRDAISNVIAGVLILVYRPFSVGQYVRVAGLEGTVEDINLRYAVLRSDKGRHFVPNQMLFTNPVTVEDHAHTHG